MKYTELKHIDTYTKRTSSHFWSETKGGEDFNRKDLKDAFDFMINYENANRFEKPTLEVSKGQALKVLNDYEKFWEDKKESEQRERVEAARIRKELTEKMPDIWKKDILPKFDNVFEELVKFSKMPGWNDAFLNEEIKNEIVKIEKIF